MSVYVLVHAERHLSSFLTAALRLIGWSLCSMSCVRTKMAGWAQSWILCSKVSVICSLRCRQCWLRFQWQVSRAGALPQGAAIRTLRSHATVPSQLACSSLCFRRIYSSIPLLEYAESDASECEWIARVSSNCVYCKDSPKLGKWACTSSPNSKPLTGASNRCVAKVSRSSCDSSFPLLTSHAVSSAHV